MATTQLHMQTTRQQILEYLRRHTRGTVKELGSLLGLTSTGIRQHLTVLERDGLVEAHEERGRVGRPTLVYSLTEKADALFPKAYDQLVNVLMEEVRATAGNDQLYKILQRVAQRLAEPHLDGIEAKTFEERVRAAAAALESQGCVAEVTEAGDGEYLIDEYSCPFPKAAEADRSVCALHVEFVKLLTGADTRLTRSLMRGECACTYRVRPAVAADDLVPVAN
ncbi:MAG TPA: helix-turn-helix domain-containing protein [Dehalococcoidia bacterium]|nr:helix-turn-helix domain-containing protein [Dehalococcoidia bacterium]